MYSRDPGREDMFHASESETAIHVGNNGLKKVRSLQMDY